MKLVIAEKPSVARSIAGVLGATKVGQGFLSGNGYYVSWCIGHLVGLCEANAYDEKYKKWKYKDLPILPDTWKHKVLAGTKGQYQVLKKFLQSDEIEEVICATDAGREGELIFRLVYEQVRCKKVIKRLWISSMESSAIKEGFENLKEGVMYDNLYQAALCRARADWLVGINATRLFTVLYGHKLPIGRVQTPTLAMLVEREVQITEFKKEPFYLVHIKTDQISATSKRFLLKQRAGEITRACGHEQALVTSVEKESKTKSAPKLYDLTTLQREANRIYGYTAQQTLDLAQTLYEKKLITYPRTDSRFLTEDMEENIENVAAIIRKRFPFATELTTVFEFEKVMNNKKVSDHHAIIPTLELMGADLNTLPDAEKKLLYLVGYKLLVAIAPKMKYETTKITLTCGGVEFTASGKYITDIGFGEVENKFKAAIKDKQEEKEEVVLPELKEGMIFEQVKSSMSEHTTTPPKPYTEDGLLLAMERAGSKDMSDEVERKGLGTPATRAAIIEKLIKSELITRKNKALLPTLAGVRLVTVLPEEIKSASLTAKWEEQLSEVAKGTVEPTIFMQGIEQMVTDLVQIYHEVGEEERAKFDTSKKVLGECPRCGKAVVEIKSGYVCTSGKECGFGLWKSNRFFKTAKRELTPDIVGKLLNEGKVKVTGLYSNKTDKRYSAYLRLEDTGDFVNFKVEFPKQKKREDI